MSKGRGYHFFNLVAELRSGVTIAQLQQELNAIASRIPWDKSGDEVKFRATSYQELLTGPVRPVLYALLGALTLVLLIACANVSNLLIALSRAAAGICGSHGAWWQPHPPCAADVNGGIGAECSGLRSRLVAGSIGDVGNPETAGRNHSSRRLDFDSPDHCASARIGRHHHHGALVAAARASSRTHTPAGGITGKFAKRRVAFGWQEAQRRTGRGRGGSLHVAPWWEPDCCSTLSGIWSGRSSAFKRPTSQHSSPCPRIRPVFRECQSQKRRRMLRLQWQPWFISRFSAVCDRCPASRV